MASNSILSCNSSSITCTPFFDNNPNIDYKGAWTQNTTNPDTKQQQTTHFTPTIGSSVSFTFNGTQILVRGIIPVGQGPLIANYTIDKGEPRTQSETILSQNTSLEFQPLFSSDILEMGEHTIDIDVLGTGVGRNYTFQQFVVAAPANATDEGTSVGGNGGGSENGNGNGSHKDSSLHSIGNDQNSVAIVGGILGSVIFLILVSLGVLFVRRKKRRSIQTKCDYEKEAIRPEALIARQDRPTHGALSTNSRSFAGEGAPQIVPFILSPLENEQTIRNMKDQNRGSRSISSTSTIISPTTSLPPYSFASAHSRRAPRVPGAPSTAGASYADSSKRFRSRSMPFEDNHFKG